jgi:hypothetical protein
MCGKEKSSKSAGRGSGGGKSATQKVKSAASSIATDLKMGLSTFGQTGEKQAQTLRDQGYSERAIQSYQERTAASKARAAEMAKSSGGDDKPAKVVTTTTDTDDTDTTTTTTTTDTTTERSTDISGAGTTSVTAESIYTRDPEEAMSDQEKLAQAELRRQRQQRAIGKAERLRTRLEGAQKFGPQGRRGGRGRRSLMTGSRGGIGYYSRFK